MTDDPIPKSTMGKDKCKASWDASTTKVFIDLCIEQLRKGDRKCTVYTKKAWANICDGFTAKTGKVYEKMQFKNKYDSIRKEWQMWNKLINETGVGWNMEKNTVQAEDEWWEKKKLENPQYEKFRTKGLSFGAELDELFSNVAATGPNAWAPLSMTLPTEQTTGYDNDDNIDLEEGSGDSDEVLVAPTGISGDMNQMTFNISQGTSGEGSMRGKELMSRSGSLGVRKRSGRMKKKKKGPASTRIADALSEIVDLTKAEVEYAHKRADEASANIPSITEVMTHLTQLDEVVADDDWYVRCAKLMLDPAMREMYVSQMGMKKQLLLFLRHLCYGD